MSEPQPTKPRKAVKKLTIDIINPDEIFAAYPKLKREDFLRTEIDEGKLRRAIRPTVNALYDMGQQVPGVKAYYASEQEPLPEGHTQLKSTDQKPAETPSPVVLDNNSVA